jgi:hypothetical protein
VINVTYAKKIQKTVEDVDYFTCKTICSDDPRCQTLCYHGGARTCQIRSARDGIMKFGSVTPGIGWWITAIKTKSW